MKKTIFGILASCLFLTACTEQKITDESTVKIGIAMARNDVNSPFLQKAYHTFETIANQTHTNIIIRDAENNQDKQYAQLDSMLADGAQVLIINLADPNKGAEVLARYCGKAPLVFYNFDPGQKNLANCNNAYFVDSDVGNGAITQGIIALKNWRQHPDLDKNKDGKIQVAVLGALDKNEDRSKWAITTLNTYPELAVPSEVIFARLGFFPNTSCPRSCFKLAQPTRISTD